MGEPDSPSPAPPAPAVGQDAKREAQRETRREARREAGPSTDRWAEPDAPPPLDPAARAAILERPDAVLADPDVMRALCARPAEGRDFIDLRAAALARLERRLSALRQAHRDMVDVAWDNLQGMDDVHALALTLMDAEGVAGVLDALTEARRPLGADAARLALPPAALAEAARRAGSPALRGVSAGGPGLAAQLFSGSRPAREPGPELRLCGPCRAAPELFGAQAPTLASQALIALDLGRFGVGVFGLGAADPARFRPGQGEDLLRFFGAVAARELRRRLGPAAA